MTDCSICNAWTQYQGDYDHKCNCKKDAKMKGSVLMPEEVPVSWTTIKAIYAMAVKELGQPK